MYRSMKHFANISKKNIGRVVFKQRPKGFLTNSQQAFGLLLWPAAEGGRAAGGRLTFLSGAYLCKVYRVKHLQTLQQCCLC